VFVSDPDRTLLGRTTLARLAAKRHDPELAAVARRAASGRAGQAEAVDPHTGRRALISWAPFGGTGWTALAVAPLDEVLAPVRALRDRLLIVGLLALLLVSGAVALVARRLARPVAAVADAAERVADGDGIATVTQASSAASEEVSASTQQTSASTQEISASARELAASAADLERLVGAFRLS
jgi:methyl-accepting chemotaxis protein